MISLFLSHFSSSVTNTLLNSSGGTIWQKNFSSNNKYVSDFKIAELDGDPEKEIIYGFSNPNPLGNDNVFAIHHNGTSIWNQSSKGAIMEDSLGVGDIDFDNLDEVVAGDDYHQIKIYDNNDG